MQKQSKTQEASKTQSNQVSSAKGSFFTSLEDLYEKKVVCLKPEDTVFDAAKEMLNYDVGDIVIAEEKNGMTVPVGIITDRDIVINTTAKKLDPEKVRLSEIMSKELITAKEDDSLTTLVSLLSDEGVRRLPIVDSDGALKGILSSKRLFKYFAQGLCELSSISSFQQEQRTH